MTSPDSLANYYFDEDEADKVIGFFAECLTHSTGQWRGKPFELLDWQIDYLRELFGWRRKDNHKRRYRQSALFISRKQGKTELAAAIALYCLHCENEPAAQCFNVAADTDQAALCFNAAKAMTENEHELDSRSEIYKRSILVPNSGSVYRVLSSSASTKHGLNVHYCGIDELHCIEDRELVDVFTTGTLARNNSLILYTSTAGFNKNSICYEIWDYALKVQDGIIDDPTFLPCIYAAPDDADWKDPATWQAACPSMGHTVDLSFYEQECLKAQQVPAYENVFRRLYLNQWTESDSRWLSSTIWDDCKNLNYPNLAGQPCYAGLDLSSVQDITALVLTFPNIAGKTYTLPFFFVPQVQIWERSRKDKVPYPQWVEQGHLIATDSKAVDQQAIRLKIHELGEKYQIKEIAIDRWNASQLMTDLEADGFEVVGFGQGYGSMSAPAKQLETMLINGDLQHPDNPVLNWMCANTVVEQDAAGNVKPSKKKSSEKIDGIVALCMALGRAMANVDLDVNDCEVIF